MSLLSFFTDKLSARAEKRVQEQADMLEKCWKQRDEELYVELFGKAETEQLTLTEELFKEEFGRQNIHPFWLHHSVLTFSPTEDRATWIYATSGMSNAWDGLTDEYSGLGIEFIMECDAPNPSAKEFMAKLMAYNLLLAMGHYKDKASLALWDILPLEEQADLLGASHIMIAPPHSFPAKIKLITGKCELLQIFKVSEKEAGIAKDVGAETFYNNTFNQN